MVVTRWGARFLGRRLPCAIGRGGMTRDKREGDGATPEGIWRLMLGGYRADRTLPPHTILPLTAIGPRDVWSDDASDPGYNHWQVSGAYPYSHERLRRSDGLYDLFLVSDWNWPEATPGAGSAIFVHQWRRPRHPTAGCIAFRPDHLAWIVRRWTPRSRIILRGSP
jgi:L,D-peptidoglycan transpeptidase YkuD (ErfK/YbiS/YcfS/YnhG family)